MTNFPKQAVIFCGGVGSRLMPFTSNTPKPMILCNDKPFLWFILQQLSEEGVTNFLLLTGYLGYQIENFFGDGGQFGWQIQYSRGPVEWETGKRFFEAKDLMDEQFLLLYSDNFTPFSLKKLFSKHLKHKFPLTFTISSKSPGNIEIDNNGKLLKYDNDRSKSSLNFVEIGYMIVEKFQTLSYFEKSDCCFSSVLEKMSNCNQIGVFIQHDSYHSISDPSRWQIAEKYLARKKIILIDRDGVINKKAPRGEYVKNWTDFVFIEDSFNAMRKLSKKGFQFIVITNQAGIARGMVDENNLNSIHKKMISEFQNADVEILDVLLCPHHWDEDCFCRKPMPGMFYKASKEHLFRLDQVVFIGDDTRDCQAAEKAGCQSIFIGDSLELKQLKPKEMPFFESSSMSKSIDSIIKFYESIPS